MALANRTITDNSKSWADNQYAGKMVNIEGDGDYHFNLITSNTSNTLVVKNPLYPVSINKNYKIYETYYLATSSLNKNILISAGATSAYSCVVVPSTGVSEGDFLNIYVNGGYDLVLFFSGNVRSFFEEEYSNIFATNFGYIYIKANSYINLVYKNSEWNLISINKNSNQKNIRNVLNDPNVYLRIRENNIYRVNVNSNNVNINIDFANIDKTLVINNINVTDCTFEIHVKMETLNTVTFNGITITWVGSEPSFNELKTYVIEFRRIDSQTNFTGRLLYSY